MATNIDAAETGDATPSHRSARALFVVTILTGSFLLFLVQPMIARMALPRLGGAPAVWNSAMLVYQALLLGGYAYAHWLGGRAPKKQGVIHIALFAVAAFWLPVGLAGFVPPSGGAVVFWVPWLLLASIGPLFLAVSAQAPLMQRWYALSGEEGEPYALYAASNFGSFAGLLAYPLLVEPFFSLQVQSWIWSGLYVVLGLLVVTCALTLRNRAPAQVVVQEAVATTPAPSWRERGYWILLAAIPSGLMLSTTTHLTTDLLAMPLIWAIPLGLYLLSFTVAFATNQTQADAIRFASPVILLVAGGFSFMGSSGTPWLGLGASILLLFTIAVVLHNQMYRSRPAPEHLTGFYLMMSIGGALGGLFCAIVAPALFDWTWEHPILILLAALLIPQRKLISLAGEAGALRGEGRTWFLALSAFGLAGSILIAWTVGDQQGGQGAFLIGLIVAIGILVTGFRWAFVLVVAALMLANGGWQSVRDLNDGARTRSYFGVYTVRQSEGGAARWLTHGTTIHGLQIASRPTAPVSYYGPRSGVGLGFARAENLYGAKARLGVVGLGTGTLACYRKPGMSFDFFEIDPAMVDIAKTRGLFSYVERCAPQAAIHIGDARLTLAEAKPASLDLLAIDAFSSDAIPVHLLTAEAFGVYDRVLAKDGILIVHISNRFIDLKPVIAAEAKARGLHAAIRADYVDSAWEAGGYRSSSWIALSRDKAKLDALTGPLTPAGIDPRTVADPVWQPLVVKGDQVRWTDDYASVLPLLSLKRLFL